MVPVVVHIARRRVCVQHVGRWGVVVTLGARLGEKISTLTGSDVGCRLSAVLLCLGPASDDSDPKTPRKKKPLESRCNKLLVTFWPKYEPMCNPKNPKNSRYDRLLCCGSGRSAPPGSHLEAGFGPPGPQKSDVKMIFSPSPPVQEKNFSRLDPIEIFFLEVLKMTWKHDT